METLVSSVFATSFSPYVLTAEKKKKCCPIIEELDKKKQMWDGLVLVMAIFNSFAVPLEYVLTTLEETPSYATLDLIINFMFFVDIVLGFRTTYFNAFGQEVREPKQIAWNYITGMFVVDFLSSIPYRYVAYIIPFFSTLSVLKILKITRISRFAPFVQKLELDEGDKAVSEKRRRLTTSTTIDAENLPTSADPDPDPALPGLLLVRPGQR